MARTKKPTAGAARPRRRTVPVDATLLAVLKDSARAFTEKFGREPGPGDPVLFDPDAETPQNIPLQKMHAMMVLTMIRAKIDDALIYAYIRTGGLIVTKASFKKLSLEDQALWRLAMEEHETHFGERAP